MCKIIIEIQIRDLEEIIICKKQLFWLRIETLTLFQNGRIDNIIYSIYQNNAHIRLPSFQVLKQRNIYLNTVFLTPDVYYRLKFEL